MNETDPLADRFIQEPDLAIDDDAPTEADAVERRLADHDEYQQADAHPDDEAEIGYVHEEYLGPPPTGVSIDQVDGGDVLLAESAG